MACILQGMVFRAGCVTRVGKKKKRKERNEKVSWERVSLVFNNLCFLSFQPAKGFVSSFHVDLSETA